MAVKVNGRNIILYKHDATYYGTDIPYACSTNCSWQINVEEQEVTNINSQYFREFKSDLIDWMVSVDGLITLSTDWNYAEVLQQILDRERFLVKFVVDNDTLGLFIVSGTVFIKSCSLAGPDGQPGTYQMQLRGSGAYSISGASVTPGGIIISGSTIIPSVRTAAGGETSITMTPSLVGKELLYISRGGTPIEVINDDGTPPAVGECTFDTVAGTVTFNAEEAAAPGEKFRALAQ